MGWVHDALKEIRQGRTARVRPLGGSMRGRIEGGQLVTLAPVDARDVRAGDAVFVRWRGSHLLHLVVEIDGDRYLIGNNVGRLNGWVSGADILAKVTDVR